MGKDMTAKKRSLVLELRLIFYLMVKYNRFILIRLERPYRFLRLRDVMPDNDASD